MANWALVIGINQYSRLPSLSYAVSDAEAMRDYFWNEANFQEIFYFSDNSPNFPAPDGSTIETLPTYGNLWSFLNDFFADEQSPPLNPGDNFWFFFSGHGIRHEDRDYLMPKDGNEIAIKETAISVNYIAERLRRSGADNVILLLDACRHKGVKSGLGIGMEKHQGVVTISSCSPKELSWEIEDLGQGSFTYVLLEALRIQGENNCATVERLYQHLRFRVPIINKSYDKTVQNPYVVPEPANKMHLILLPDQATPSDIITLKEDAWRAESQSNWELANQLWIRINAAAKGLDIEPLDGYARTKQSMLLSDDKTLNENNKTKVPWAYIIAGMLFVILFYTLMLEFLSNSPRVLNGNVARPGKFSGSDVADTDRQKIDGNPTIKPTPDEVSLSSESGIDYTKLEDLLAAQKFIEAEEETWRIMLQVTGREEEGYLRIKDTGNFPCGDLRTIDRLWVKSSDRRFGFSIQKQIYQELGQTAGFDGKTWEAFGDRAGWRQGGSWLSKKQLNSETSARGVDVAPPGRFPYVGHLNWHWDLFPRIETCEL